MDGLEPTSFGEIQLHKVLQRANLLSYFEIFISQGGDDVQQLCEAGEEEFLEIMSLVGMASKPLHVRRLQKVLQEWVTSPNLFQNILNISPRTKHPHPVYSSPSGKSKHAPSRSHYEHGHRHKGRAYIDKHSSLLPKTNVSSGSANKHQQEYKVEETTSLMLAQAAMEMVEAKFPHRLSYEKAIEFIKSSQKRPHLIRVLEMENIQTREREMRRQAAVFPFADRFATSPLNVFELMCNEASVHLCQLHPVLLITERSERLVIAQAVVKNVQKQLKQSPRELLDLSIGGRLQDSDKQVQEEEEGCLEELDVDSSDLAELARAHNVGLFDDASANSPNDKHTDCDAVDGTETNCLTADVVIKKELMGGFISTSENKDVLGRKRNVSPLCEEDELSMLSKHRRTDS